MRSTSAPCLGLIAVLLAALLAVPCRAETEVPPEIVFLTWSDYVDPEVVAEFEASSGIRVKQVYYETDDARDDIMVETDGRGYDVVLVNGIQVNAYRRHAWLAPLGDAEVPTLRHVHERWRGALPGTEGYGVPYFWGTIGVAYRRDLVAEPITSWLQLYRPSPDLRGKIAMIKSARDAIGMALKALGHSTNSTDPAALDDAERLLLEQRPHVKSYTYVSLGEESDLVRGDIAAAMIYNGDALMLREHHPEIAFAVPREGGALWVDYLTVPAASHRKALAFRFIDFLTEPRNAARNAEFVHYATTNRGAEKLLPVEYFADPVIYPPQEVLARCELDAELAPRATKRRNAIFARVLQ